MTRCYPPPRHERRGFTLVELLVVVAIIGLLIAILVPSLSLARRQARGVVCRSNMKQLMNGMFYYIADYNVFPATHSLFYFQNLFTAEWPRISGVTWDGARDNLVGLNFTDAYTEPHHLDPEFIRDVPGRGTLFPYIKDPSVYVCPADHPGKGDGSPLGGGGNGQLSFSLNAYVGYKAPDQLQSFTYVADAPNNPLPGDRGTRSFSAGERVTFAAADFMTLFEEHPGFHINAAFPEGNFNGIDRIATRHSFAPGAAGEGAKGRANIAHLDGHVDGPFYPALTEGRQLFAEVGQPFYWRKNGPQDRANVAAFIKRLGGPCPW